MAPPSSRRSGHSRKAQYSVFTGYALAVIGALIGAILLGVSLWNPSAFGGLRGGANDAVQPVAEAGAAARTNGAGFFGGIRAYFRAGSQNAALREEVELARVRLTEAQAVEQENARLKSLLGLKEQDAVPVVVTRLIGSTSSSTRRFAYVGAGRASGVKPGMAVRSPRGVVGRILESGANSSRVLLLTDSESVLPVRRAKDEVVAFAEGRGDGLLRIRLINLGLNPLKPGDVFVTSGAGGFYRPGMAVAVLNEVTPDGGVARMIADPLGTDFVSIEPIWQPLAVTSSDTPPEQSLATGNDAE